MGCIACRKPREKNPPKTEPNPERYTPIPTDPEETLLLSGITDKDLVDLVNDHKIKENLSPYLPADQIDLIIETFKTVSPDLGPIDRKQFDQAINLIYSKQQKDFKDNLYIEDHAMIDTLFMFFDHDKNETIEFKEFLTGYVLITGGSPDARARALFRTIDADNDGTITAEELEIFFSTALTSAKKEITNVALDPGNKHDFSQESLERTFRELESAYASEFLSRIGSDQKISKDQFVKYYLKNERLFQELARRTTARFLTFLNLGKKDGRT
eukprot:TRINITY_DN11792_c0_g1_i1.p1 TRINITY_DN11792_c0_g1~~TRINITY_DN11792_c0_g1_i1.p1  ORF type:complete len:271 (-),score=63.62 TRINITY_DN11792_c0_g1_i1:42-854(-)